MARKRAKKHCTVWKLEDFAASWILREINAQELQNGKYCHLSTFKGF